MADNVNITPGSGATVAADLINDVYYQRIKLGVGADGTATDLDFGQAAMAASLPVVVASDQNVPIGRGFYVGTLTIASGTSITGELDMRTYAGGFVFIPSTWTAANLGFKMSPTNGGNYGIANDYLGAPIQISGIGTAEYAPYQIPDEMFPAGYVKLWSKSTTAATETDVSQGAERTLIVVLKG